MEQLVKRMEELESQLEQRARAQRQAEQQAEGTQREMELAEERYREAHRKHEAAADEIAGLVEEVQRLRSGGASSVSPASGEGQQGKVEEELQALQERHRTLEQTHIKAVQYVKGTEKMLRRMKEELSKYKERTEALEAELSSLRDASGSGGGGEARMAVEMRQQMAELTIQLESLRHSSRESSLENEELQRRMGQLQAEYAQDRAEIEMARGAELEGVRSEMRRVEKKNEGLRREIGEVWEQNKKLYEQVGGGGGSNGGSNGGGQKQVEWLKKENLELQSRCRDAEAKISLLLDHMENRSEA